MTIDNRHNILANSLRFYKTLSVRYPKPMKIVRFVISGGTATAVNLGTLFVCTHFFGIWYLASSVIAFVLSFAVSFTMQKFWTFDDRSRDRMHVQAVRYLVVILFALGINTALIYMFVEYGEWHYLLAQFVSGVFIAVINYFSYKHLVFHTAKKSTAIPSQDLAVRSPLSLTHGLLCLFAVIIFSFLATYRLSENPPTWLDEGTITQVAINITQNGIYGLQTAPGQFVSTDFLTTSFPVIYPITLSFSLFGVTIFNARIVMVVFMTLLCVCAYFLVRATAKEKPSTALLSLLLLITFAPLYGHGKNVLGEVPGLMFFVTSLLLWMQAEKRASLWWWVFSGLTAGLAMVTKPIYLFIIIPSAFLIFFIRRRRIPLSRIAAYAAGSVMMLVAWFFIHFTSIEALREIIFAANANDVPLAERVFHTSAQFISEIQPIYFLGLLALWGISLILRIRKEVSISTIELYAAIFSFINLILYIASRGFYRYFFPAEALALLFLPIALYRIPIKDRYRGIAPKILTSGIVLLILFQGYQTFFHSWISEYRSSMRSGLLSENLREIQADKSIFFYNVPEAVIFLPSENYYQYLRFGDNVIRGDENLPLLFAGNPDFVLVDQKFPDTEKIVPLYRERSRFDKYILYERKDLK